MLTNDQMKARRFQFLYWRKHPEALNAPAGGVDKEIGKTRPWSEVWAFESDPKYLAKLKVYHLDHIGACKDGEWSKLGLIPEDQLKKTRKRKPATPKLTHCPHCGECLTDPVKAKIKLNPVSIEVKQQTRFVKVGNNFVPYRIPA